MPHLAPLLLLSLLTCPPQDDPEASWDRWREHLLPAAEDEPWLELGWRQTFWDAVVEAQETDRPILLWAMNGHPLGCT